MTPARAAYMRHYYEANKDKYLTYVSRGLTRAERVAEIQRKYSGGRP